MTNTHYWAWSYVDQKFSGAVETLASSFAPNWQRMHDALMHFIALLPSHFPESDLYDRYERLHEEATAYGPFELDGRPYWGSYENTLRRRKRRTLERYANEILEISREIRKRRGQYPD